ncbi:MAG: hypothetical protein ACLT0Y_04340 [Christensenellales bacterium]
MSIKRSSEIKGVCGQRKELPLLFCVDEVGYIGIGDLMMNLQSLVEDRGQMPGQGLVMVTQPEAIDSVEITGNDFKFKVVYTRLTCLPRLMRLFKSVFWRRRRTRIIFCKWNMKRKRPA